jgi:hypothetical protein
VIRVATSGQLSPVFSALADPTRRGILAELTLGDATVTELTDPLPFSMPAVSRPVKVLEGVIRVSGHLPGGFEPIETRFRFAIYDETDGRTRLEVRQWLPDHVAGATEEGWRQSFTELDALLAKRAAA